LNAGEAREQFEQRITEMVTLCVGRLVDGELKGSRLDLHRSTSEALRTLAEPVVERFDNSEAVPYTSGNELEDNQFFFVDDADTLADLAPFRMTARELGQMPVTAPADLDASVEVTVIGFGEDDDDRVVAVQKNDPRLKYRGGRFFAIARETLYVVEEPVFSFIPRIDFLVGPGWAIVLQQKQFETLLRHVSQVEQRIGGWVESIAGHLPMAAGSADALRDVALRDSRTWRRLREIHHRGHLADVSMNQVRAYAGRVGLDSDRVVQDGQLVFDPADRFGFLHLLNEDLYRGPLTDDVFEAQRKASTD
jgi:hypothetical protein